MEEICFAPAVELARRLRARDIGAVELLEIFQRHIAAVNPSLNALVTLCEESALAEARAADHALARGTHGPLCGLPVAIKDIFDTRGCRSTRGSPLFAAHLPVTDDLPVARQRAAGAVIVGKTNLPEFSYGGQTTNALFGATRNPYAAHRSVCGSSGGSAVALASGLVALADGSDIAGSLRGPAAWCNVVGFRPSSGLVPRAAARMAWDRLDTAGPMARTVADVGLLLSVMAGNDSRVPLAGPAGVGFDLLAARPGQWRVAFSAAPGGREPDAEVASAMTEARAVLVDLGCVLGERCPQIGETSEALTVLKTVKMASDLQPVRDQEPSAVNQALRAGLDRARTLTAFDVMLAEEARTRLWHELQAFMAEWPLLVWPTTSRVAYAADDETAAQAFDWLTLEVAPLLGLPAVSVPCGFGADGVPVGLQITGRPGADVEVLRLAHAFEQATGHWRRRPAGSNSPGEDRPG